jgi:GntR family transcriptional regulator
MTPKLPLTPTCNMVHITPVIPFRLALQSGMPVTEQVAFAAKKAILSGRLRPGDPFPSVRAISTALKIPPTPRKKSSPSSSGRA